MIQELAVQTLNQYLAAGEQMTCPGGSMFLLRSAIGFYDVAFYRNGRRMGAANGISQGWAYEAPQPFDEAIITAGQNGTVVADVANGKMQFNGTTPDVQATIVQASMITPLSVFAVGTAYVVVSPGGAGTGIREIVIKNIGSTVIYLGGPDVSASSPIELAAGDYWRDTAAAEAAWCAISSAAGGSVSVYTFIS